MVKADTGSDDVAAIFDSFLQSFDDAEEPDTGITAVLLGSVLEDGESHIKVFFVSSFASIVAVQLGGALENGGSHTRVFFASSFATLLSMSEWAPSFDCG
eukprot:CAMPEP_0195302694 /NCGR_PEP_ID=MMETSP0707-20130614/31533_1 /TAXON_ID=33640 /ORGANISM="Asterionellopsis glacialis, Strain CCMP134" /LENGTH=99 /DNA_ID=CAMNT_0040366023 /DNA_START=78 /DNA_END=377 /DNA_ORIENTATION=-